MKQPWNQKKSPRLSELTVIHKKSNSVGKCKGQRRVILAPGTKQPGSRGPRDFSLNNRLICHRCRCL